MADEDEALQRALALSLVTAREDEVRRKQLYSSVESIHKQPTNNLNQDRLSASNSMPDFMVTPNIPKQPSAPGTSTIPRPRPQSKQGGVLQLSLPGPPKVPPRPDQQDGQVLPPRPKASPSVQPHSISPTPMAPPMIPPPQPVIRSRPGPGLYDDKSRSSSMPPPSNRPQVEAIRPPPSVTSSPQRQIIITQPPTNSSDLILLSPPSRKSNPFDFNLDSFDPLRQNSEIQTKKESNVSSLLPPAPQTRKVSDPTTGTLNNPTYGMYLPSKPSVPPRPRSISDQNPSPVYHAATLPKPQMAKRVISEPGSDLPPRPSKDLIYASLPRMAKDSPDLPSPSPASSTSDIANSLQQPSGSDSSPGDDLLTNLMDFNLETENLSLESFDPLFSLSVPDPPPPSMEEPISSKDSLFETPTKTSLPEDTPASDCDPTGKKSDDEVLQDPFSVSDLTQALERKRQKHANIMKKKMEEEEKKRKEIEAEKKMVEKEKKIMEDTAPSHVHKRSLSKGSTFMVKGRQLAYERLQVFQETADEEISSFCQMVARIKLIHPFDEYKDNPGILISPKVTYHLHCNLSVKLTVYHSDAQPEPFVFTCNLNATVEHVILNVLMMCTEDMDSVCLEDWRLKVFGLSEYFLNDSKLAEFEYIQRCLKLDQDIRLIMQNNRTLPKPFKRTVQDDNYAVFVPKTRDPDENCIRVTRDKLNILIETFYKEVEKLRDLAIQKGCESVHCKGVIQAMKAVSAVMHKIETVDMIKAAERLESVTGGKRIKPAGPNDADAFLYLTSTAGSKMIPISMTSLNSRSSMVEQLDDLHLALEDVTLSVKNLIEMYCRTFHTDFRFESAFKVSRDRKPLLGLTEDFIVHIATAHRIPAKTKNDFEEYKVICGLFYGGNRLTKEVVTTSACRRIEGFQETVVWDEWVHFEGIRVSALPRETKLVLNFVGIRSVQHSTNEGLHRVHTSLGWVAMQVFNYAFELVQGSQLLGLWPGDPNPLGTSISNTERPNSPLMQINLPDFDCDIVFPSIPEPLPSQKCRFEDLHPGDQEVVFEILDKDAASAMSAELYVFLWEKRHYLYACPLALPRVLAACPCWSYATLRETYTMVQQWVPVDPVFALELLLPQYADTYVRNCAVERIKELPTDSMYDYLPQIIQALKYECYHTSALAKMLLERSVTNARFAHQMYWLLKEAADDYRYRKRYQLLFGALLSVVGESMRTEFVKEEDFIKMTSAIADKVKAAKEKENVLQKELENMWDFLSHSSVRLPLNAACEVSGVDVKSCSYYTSFTFPLKLVMKNIDVRAEPIYSMFKVGDDLRQDMLTMQLVRIMDRLWLQDNLDLKIITFGCQPTGNRKGLVEIVTESDTLRKIQVKHGHGVTGSFKDKPISDWLQQQNPTELDYEKAVDNFSSSCAGYCVATYVLGIGDRHNDNIMIKQSGHLFHIDFSKFLGDSQMFGNFKRDRVPFVLTSDMAYVINGGDRQSSHFQSFVDQCCRAFNILRKHRILLVNLFSLMTLSGIPGVTSDAARYVHKALLPESTDAEATAMFTRMIYKSLESTFTQVNFFIHNLAQMKFSGHQEGALLSFIPKTFSLQTDGKISKVEVFGFQKRYNPEKYYIFIIKVVREGQQVPSFVFRRYSEFQELHQKLVVTFPLVKLPSFTGKVLLGRTHVRSVAETRKQELDAFLKQLLLLASEIAEHDLIYTFFHPMLRDEQEIDKTNLQKLKVKKTKEGSQSRPHTNPLNFEGKVKLSLTYKTNALTVMIMHVKDLSLLPSGDPPDPYVKLYLMPDAMKVTKRKTKIAKATLHPTYNEMLMYRMSWEELKNRTLQVSVWSYDGLKENEFMGAAHIVLSDLNLSQEVVGWYPLLTLHKLSLHSAGPL